MGGGMRDAELRPDAECRRGMRGSGEAARFEFGCGLGKGRGFTLVGPFIVSHGRIHLTSQQLVQHPGFLFCTLHPGCIGSKFRIPHSSSASCIREHRGESRHSHLPLAYFAGAMLHGGTTPFMRAYAIDWPRCSPACSAIASKRARFVIFEPKKSTITPPSPSGVAAAAFRTAANPAFIVEMTFSLPSGQCSTVFRSMFAGVFAPSGSAIRKLSPPMCRNTSHTERTPAPGRHEYFSHGIAFASRVYLPSRPF